MLKTKATTVAAALLVGTSLLCPPARADDPANTAAARELFRSASRDGKAGDWASARDNYTRSLALHHSAITLYSLAVAQRELGETVAALENLRAYMRADKSPQAERYRPKAERAITELEQAVARVIVTVRPATASVTFDGRPLPQAALGHPRLCDSGSHEIVVSADGYVQARRRLDIGPGEATEVVFDLDPRPTDLAPSSDGDAPFPVGPVALTSAGGATLIAGLVVGGLGLSQANDAVDGTPEADAARTKGVAADALIGVGAAGAVAGVAWLIVELTGTPADDMTAVRPWAGGNVAGVAWSF